MNGIPTAAGDDEEDVGGCEWGDNVSFSCYSSTNLTSTARAGFVTWRVRTRTRVFVCKRPII